MIKNLISFMPRISTLILLLGIQFFMSAAEISKITINGDAIENIERSEWKKTKSDISIFDSGGREIMVQVEPDAGRINLKDAGKVPFKVFIRDKAYDSTVVQFPKEIRKFRVGIRLDKKSQEKYIKFKIKLGKNLEFERTDLLIVTLLYKLGIRMISRTVTMKIFIRDSI